MTEWLDVSDTTPRIAYTATSGQQIFTVPFQFLDEADLLVYVDDVLQTLATDYTTTGEGSESSDGRTITFTTGLTAGDIVVIARELDLALDIHIPTTGQLDIPAINLMFSRFVMMLQQIDTERVRSIRQPAADVDDLDALPIAATRASKYLAFDADGQPSLVASVASAVSATAFMLTLLDDTSAAAARATLGITDQSSYTGLSNWHFCR